VDICLVQLTVNILNGVNGQSVVQRVVRELNNGQEHARSQLMAANRVGDRRMSSDLVDLVIRAKARV